MELNGRHSPLKNPQDRERRYSFVSIYTNNPSITTALNKQQPPPMLRGRNPHQTNKTTVCARLISAEDVVVDAPEMFDGLKALHLLYAALVGGLSVLPVFRLSPAVVPESVPILPEQERKIRRKFHGNLHRFRYNPFWLGDLSNVFSPAVVPESVSILLEQRRKFRRKSRLNFRRFRFTPFRLGGCSDVFSRYTASKE